MVKQAAIFVLAVLNAALAFASDARADAKRVGVLEFKNFAGLSAFEAQQITDMVRMAAGDALPVGEYLVMTRESILQLLPPDKRDLAACEGECEVETGRNIGADYVVTGEVGRFGKKLRVSMKLYDTKSAALLVMKLAEADSIDDLSNRLSAEARRLLEKLPTKAGEKATAGLGRPGFKEGAIGGAAEDWTPETQAEFAVVKFVSQPEGAVVMLDGRLLCHKTPCSKNVAKDVHDVSMQLEKYEAKSERIRLEKDAKVAWTLAPEFGRLTVRSTPSGLPVTLNGESKGKTPLENLELMPGGYEVLVDSPCHHSAGERVRVEKGKDRVVSVNLPPKEGAIAVSAEDEQGNAVNASVLVDGVEIGSAPGTFKVSVCARNVEIKSAGYEAWNKELTVGEKKTQSLKGVLSGGERGRKASGGCAKTSVDGRYCDHGDGTVTDRQTNLTWQGSPSGRLVPWPSAIDYCKELELADHDDWRVPAVGELRSLIRGCAATESGGRCIVSGSCLGDPCVSRFCDGCVGFRGPSSGGCYWGEVMAGDCSGYWSSSVYPAHTPSAWRVDFYDASVAADDNTSSRFVRCVRGVSPDRRRISRELAPSEKAVEDRNDALGSILITSSPLGEIYVDGKSYGIPPVELRNVKSRNYQVEFRKAGYKTKSLKINVKPGDNPPVFIKLEAE